MRRLPWRAVVGWAIVGWLVCLTITLTNLAGTVDELGGLVDARPDQPSAPLLARELGEGATRPGGGHDGAYFYALAADPLHPVEVAPYLDRPRYRAQRVLFPALTWLAQPTGGGPGRVWAMFAIGAAGVLLGGLAMGALSAQLGGSPVWGLAFGALTGSWVSLRISTPDPLAVALALLAVLLALRGRSVAAVAMAVAAVLTKEPVLLVLAGFALARRDRTSVAMVGVPVVVAAAWWVALRLFLPAGEGDVVEFGLPFLGWIDSARFWAQGNEPLGMLNVLFGVGVGVAALVRRPRTHPLWYAVALNLALTVVLTVSVLAPERNATRSLLALQAVGLLTLVTPGPAGSRRSGGRRADAAGTTGGGSEPSPVA